jgi:hypothetical protein
MDRLAVPTLFLGPSGSGKLRTARARIEEAYGVKLTPPFEVRTFPVGDGYEAKVLSSPYHFEIDIPNLSMQDKQIIGELLTTFFSSGDVFNAMRSHTRKLVILRRAHSLSQPAAIRVRAILQQYVFPPDATGMIWMTAREITGSVALLEDGFVRHSVPRMPYATWSALPFPAPLLTEKAYSACEGRQERAEEILKFFPDGSPPAWPRRICDFYDELVGALISVAQSTTPPKLEVIAWIRARIYQALSFCQTGPEIVDSCAAALSRLSDRVDAVTFFKCMRALTLVEPHTSYRTPLSLEAGLLALFENLRTNSKKTVPPVKEHGQCDTISVDPATRISLVPATSTPATAPTPVKKRRAPARKKTSSAE